MITRGTPHLTRPFRLTLGGPDRAPVETVLCNQHANLLAAGRVMVACDALAAVVDVMPLNGQCEECDICEGRLKIDTTERDAAFRRASDEVFEKYAGVLDELAKL